MQQAEGYPMGSRLQYPPRLVDIVAVTVHACFKTCCSRDEANHSNCDRCLHAYSMSRELNS